VRFRVQCRTAHLEPTWPSPSSPPEVKPTDGSPASVTLELTPKEAGILLRLIRQTNGNAIMSMFCVLSDLERKGQIPSIPQIYDRDTGAVAIFDMNALEVDGLV